MKIITFRAAAVLALFAFCASAFFVPVALAANVTVANGAQFTTTTGDIIHAHGGGMIKVGSYYYWFGENRNPDSTMYAVSCYRSTDLKNWEFRNHVLTANSSPDLNPANIERPKVVFNAATNRYVMWMHWENGVHYGEARCAVASSATVDGNYTYHRSFRPYADRGVEDHGRPGYMSRDCTLFVDTDGRGYFVSASNENADLHLYRLTPDYLDIDVLVQKLWLGQKREAPILFRRNGVYFMLTSGATGWLPNQQKYATATSLEGTWSALQNLGNANGYQTQGAHAIAVQGTQTTSYLYLADRWAGAWGGRVNDSEYVWLPLTFPTSTTVSMSWYENVNIDAATGVVSGVSASPFVSGAYYKIVNRLTGKVLGIESGSTADGAVVEQWSDGGWTSQHWQFISQGGGFYQVKNRATGKVFDIPTSSRTDGTVVKQYGWNGGRNQQWHVFPIGGGYHKIRNLNSMKALDIVNTSTANGADAMQATYDGETIQHWSFVRVN
jgi:hypothetical protein